MDFIATKLGQEFCTRLPKHSKDIADGIAKQNELLAEQNELIKQLKESLDNMTEAIKWLR